ncbi:hypothetical protein [Flagellimonas meridianipacifica]|nr:hypothetical protein [Allomuricauda pacifica]
MKEQSLKDKTTEKLQSELKTIKSITGVLIGVLIVLFSVIIYGLLTKENNSSFIALIAVGISCCGVLPLQFTNMKKIKSELDSRNKDN